MKNITSHHSTVHLFNKFYKRHRKPKEGDLIYALSTMCAV